MLYVTRGGCKKGLDRRRCGASGYICSVVVWGLIDWGTWGARWTRRSSPMITVGKLSVGSLRARKWEREDGGLSHDDFRGRRFLPIHIFVTLSLARCAREGSREGDKREKTGAWWRGACHSDGLGIY